MRLEEIESPRVLKGMSVEEMNDLASQIRSELVATV